MSSYKRPCTQNTPKEFIRNIPVNHSPAYGGMLYAAGGGLLFFGYSYHYGGVIWTRH